jgi:alpha-beta hydrolase superfamily lysophospholipase
MYVKTVQPMAALQVPVGFSGTPDTSEAQQSCIWLPSNDGLKLFIRRWTPLAPPRAVLHIIHGMAEHSQRYERLARKLAKAGFAVWAADMRGHGKTADPSINDPARGGLLGHCSDNDAVSRISADIDLINKTIGETEGDIPLFLLGHSWGSFLAQNYIETYGHRLSGCILSGTRGPDGLKVTAGLPLMTALTALKGVRKPSALAHAIADGAYNKPFKPNRTPFDWLSRDETQVNAFINDPLCGQRCSSGFYRDLLFLLNKIHRAESLSTIKRDLPIYVISGSADPVGDMGNSPTALVNVYRSMGIRDLEFVLYPDARHELLNETNRQEVTDNLLTWLEKHCEQPASLFPQETVSSDSL